MAAIDPVSIAGARILVTGGTGFIGAHLCRELARGGAEVWALSRSGAPLQPLEPSPDNPAVGQIHSVKCDLRSAEATHRAVEMAAPGIVYHLAAHPDQREGSQQTAAVLDHNISAVANLLEALRTLPAASLVFADSAKVYGNSGVPYRSCQPLEPLSTYAVSKNAGWGLIDVYRRVHGIRAISLRPTLIYGPAQGLNIISFLLGAIATGREEISLDGGEQTRDPIYIDDAIRAFVAVATRFATLDGQVLPIGGGRELSVRALGELAVRLLGGRQRVIARHDSIRPTETMRSWCDNAEMTMATGWRPKVGLEEGIRLTAGAAGMAVVENIAAGA